MNYGIVVGLFNHQFKWGKNLLAHTNMRYKKSGVWGAAAYRHTFILCFRVTSRIVLRTVTKNGVRSTLATDKECAEPPSRVMDTKMKQ